MEARCYRGEPGRTRYRRLAMAPADYGALAFFFLTVGLVLGLERV